MRRYLYIYVALALVTPALLGQKGPEAAPNPQRALTTQTPHPDDPADYAIQPPATRPGESREAAQPAQRTPARQTRPAAPQTYLYGQSQKRPPAAQYSPLAAQGGYGRHQRAPWQMVVNYFNPRHLNLGQLMEERRQAWLDNVAANEYFWYAACATGMLLVSWTVLWWVNDDRLRALAELAENAADALRYSEYCKREAKAAIRRHNEHVDKCNRVIEDQRSGVMTTPEAANMERAKKQIESLTNDNQANEYKIKRLNEEIKAKEKLVSETTARLNELEPLILDRKTKAPATDSSPVKTNGSSPNAELVERINRVEKENQNLREENRQIRQQQRQVKTTSAPEDNQGGE